MQESPHYQPTRLEEFLLENNAMLQSLIHNMATLMQHSVGMYSMMYEHITGQQYKPGNPVFEANSKQIDEKLKFYKKATADILNKNMEIHKKWQERTIR